MYSVGLIQKQPFAFLTCLSLIAIALSSKHISQVASILPRLKQQQNHIHTPQPVNASLGLAV
jgi:hypothetical protein